MSAATETAVKNWTEAELEALPDDGFDYEVVNGRIVMSPKNSWFHGRICTRLLFALETYNRTHHRGAVLDSSTGFWMFNRNCRAPDVSFVLKERLALLGFKPNERRFFPGAPDLAVEVLSPGNSRSDVEARLNDFFGSGSQLVWIINPDLECAEVCRSLTDRKLIGPGGLLDGERLLPGFSFPISDLFKEWDWDVDA